jgi:hypothetical protein
MDDPFNNYKDWGVGGYNYPAYGPPREADLTVVFPDRTRYWLTSCADSLSSWLVKFPNGFQIGNNIYSKKQIQDIIDEIRNPAKLDVLVNFWVDLNVVHEVGHACNVCHHGGCPDDTNKTSTGDPKCPTKYRNEFQVITTAHSVSDLFRILDDEKIIPIVTYTGWKFCKSGDNCWNHLNVNDR